ncbi:hypothetical protein QVO32_01305 [Bacteroides gallinaceum]|uniref:hypothetical protein n=1 Tax=Bacteroides gallinaceum TaxID=1462571 RepID=UPI0025AAB4DA|nr:hypothetical protein [Bacteroides gallinaceum]MDN0078064.1 hypothetical protein [Bacteroides gallinaceum]
MIGDEFLRHFRFCDEEDSGLSDEEQERKEPKNRPKHTRKRIHQAKKYFLEKFKTASYASLFILFIAKFSLFFRFLPIFVLLNRIKSINHYEKTTAHPFDMFASDRHC